MTGPRGRKRRMQDTKKAVNIENVIAIAREAGERILDIYDKEELFVEYKEDASPLTQADKASHDLIVGRLKALTPDIPILSEEDVVPYEKRKDWKVFWLVDPLDGTKEFIKRNGEFTVNIALIEDKAPVMGVIGVPVSGDMYYAVKGEGAFKITKDGKKVPIHVIREQHKDKVTVVASRSHKTKELEEYVEGLKKRYKSVEYISAGSSLKFCLIAEGKAHIYPRLGPTMEWDTAAGQVLAERAVAVVISAGSREALQYNKRELLNPSFMVKPEN